jgi:hypothetical protein
MSRETVIVIREDDQFIALDSNSGGYPYLVDSPWKAQHWDTPAHAESYRSKFLSRYENWRIQMFRATFLQDITKTESKEGKQ